MIVIGPIANFMRGARPVRSAHLLSDLTGNAGTGELMGFGRKIGLKAAWLQNGNTDTEHFHLAGKKIDEAIAAGALRIDRHRLVKIAIAKRGYFARKAKHQVAPNAPPIDVSREAS